MAERSNLPSNLEKGYISNGVFYVTKVIGRPALKLLRCSILDSSLVNTSSFLLLNYSSVNSLKEQLKNTDFELSSTVAIPCAVLKIRRNNYALCLPSLGRIPD